MKIALVGLRLTVGPRLIVDTMGPALRRLGLDVVFVGERSYEPPEEVRAIPVSEGGSYPAMMRETLRPGLYGAAADALAREQPDLCYFVSVHPANAPLAWRIRRTVRTESGKAPLIAMHIHDPVPHPGAASLAIFLAQQLQARTADSIVVYGATLAAQVSRWYGVSRRRIVTLRHGASREPREVPPPEPAAYRWFSFLGRIEPYKGLDAFLEAAALLRRGDPSARFYVGGAGELAPYRRAIAALGESVIVENRELTNDETDEVMQGSWAVVLPYHTATQSGVIPVAYWNACPVIVTRAGGLAEVVRDNETGFVVNPGDVDAIAGSMRKLAGDPALRWKLGSGAFSFYDRWLRWERIADDFVRALGVAAEASRT